MEMEMDLKGLENKKVVFSRGDDEPHEAPGGGPEKGHLYVNAEEVMPDLVESTDADESKGPKLNVDRRDFMRLFSASAIMASSAACVRRPLEKAVPYVNQPIDQVPGVPVYYATTDEGGCGLLVKTREGRPVFIEGNPQHPLSLGGTDILAASTLQDLYHPDRRKQPLARMSNNKTYEVEWEDIFQQLADYAKSGKVAFLVPGTTGHQTQFLERFLKQIGQSPDQIYSYESQPSVNALSEAYRIAFGEVGTPRVDIGSAKLIVGIGAEYLDHGPTSVRDTKGWSRSIPYRDGSMGHSVQFESRLTCTGAKASVRYPIGAGDEFGVALLLVQALLKTGAARGSASDQAVIKRFLADNSALIDAVKTSIGSTADKIGALADDLLAKRSVVLVGQVGAADSNATLLQIAGIFANILTGAFGKTMHLDRSWMSKGLVKKGIQQFIADAKKYDMVIAWNVNPVFTMPAASGIKEIFANIPHLVSIQNMPSEMDEYAELILNGHHFLESWGDENPVAGFWSTRQPAVRPITNSRQFEDILLWTLAKMGKELPYADYRSYIKDQWKSVYDLVFSDRKGSVDFETFFSAVLRKGFVNKEQKQNIGDLKKVSGLTGKPPAKGLRLVAHLDNRLLDGRGASRPVLQECPDPNTSVSWDTWIAINPYTARALGVRYNDVVKVEGPGGSFEGAIYPLPGLHPDTVAVPRGNGRAKGMSRVCDDVGFDPLVALGSEVDPLCGTAVTGAVSIKLTKTGRRYRLASQQKHNDINNRTDIVKTVSLSEAIKNRFKVRGKNAKSLDDVPDLYPALPKAKSGYKWGMTIDIDRCNGCGTCNVACSLENNVPQVGREQVMLGRAMHWVRTDRYFAGSPDNPTVTYQPVSCQQCNHAPCEAVCPVFATTHDAEGINSQTYNRCVGTTY